MDSKWQQEFTSKVNALREGWTSQFEAIGDAQVGPVYQAFSDFARRCELKSSAVPDQQGLRSYKFELCEDAYVMLYFRPRGVDQVECDYECFLPGVGRVSGIKSSAAAANLQKEWVDSCFRMALDDLVTRFSECRRTPQDAELALA